MYDISQRHQSGPNPKLPERLNAYINNEEPHLIRKISEQDLYADIASQLFTYASLSTFKVEGVEAIETVRKNSKADSNLGIVLGNGSRMYVYIDARHLILNELVNLPDLTATLQNETNTLHN